MIRSTRSSWIPHPIWLDAVEMVLARIGASVVLKTSSARDALAAIERDQPRLLTLELDTQPGEPDGFEVIRRATALSRSLRAIVLSTHQDAAHIDGALAAGAAAYVVKTAHPDDVASAVRQAFDHSVYLPGGPLAVGQPLAPEVQHARGERPGGSPVASSRFSSSWPRDIRTRPWRGCSGSPSRR